MLRDGKNCIIKSTLAVEGQTEMAISYNKLWNLLVDKKMSKAELRKAAGIAPNPGEVLEEDKYVGSRIRRNV